MPVEPTRTRRVSVVLNITLLGIDSNYEPVTRAAFQYREKHVYPYLQGKGFAITKLQVPLPDIM